MTDWAGWNLMSLRNHFIRISGAIICLVAFFLSGCDQSTHPVTGSVAGSVFLNQEDPVTGSAGILVFLAGTPYQARTDKGGQYRIQGISAGTYDLVAEKPGFQSQIQSIIINPEVNTDDNPLRPPSPTLTRLNSTTATVASQVPPVDATVDGHVLLEGDTLDNGGVRVELDGTAFVGVSATDGKFRIPAVEPGSYTISYYKTGYKTYKTDQVDITTGTNHLADVGLELDGKSTAPAVAKASAPKATPAPPPIPVGMDVPRSITGHVVLTDADKEPVTDYSDVNVAIDGTDNIVQVDENGRFHFDGLTSGSYVVLGVVAGGSMAKVKADVGAVRTVDVTLNLSTVPPERDAAASVGIITGKVAVLGPDDRQLADNSGVFISLEGTQVSATTDKTGSFRLESVPAGEYSLGARKDGYDSAQVDHVKVAAGGAADVGTIQLSMKKDYPKVLATSPENDAINVLVDMDLTILVKFSKRMDIGSVKDAVVVHPSVPYQLFMGQGTHKEAGDDTLVIVMSNADSRNPIKFKQKYTVEIANSASDSKGVAMKDDYRFSFTTGLPGVTSTIPENGRKDVILNQVEKPVLIFFNTKLKPDTINSRNIRVRPDNRVSVSTTWTTDPKTGWTNVRVATQWQSNVNYTITIGNGVRAFNGQMLGNTPYTFRFHTAKLEVMPVPLVEIR